MINYTTEKLDQNNVLFHFTLPAADYDEVLENMYRAHKDQYDVPGIRKGKATRKMVETYLGRSAFTMPALDQIIPDAYGRAKGQHPEEIYYTPTVKILQNEPGKDLIFTAQAQINPQCELCDYRAVRLTEQDRKEIEESLAGLPESNRNILREHELQAALVARIAQESLLDVPEAMIRERALSMKQALEVRLQADQSTLEDYYKGTASDEQLLMEQLSERAKEQLRSRIAMLAIAKAEGLEATQEEYDAELHRLSDMYMMPEDQLRKLFLGGEGEKVKKDIAVSKVAKFIEELMQRQDESEQA